MTSVSVTDRTAAGALAPAARATSAVHRIAAGAALVAAGGAWLAVSSYVRRTVARVESFAVAPGNDPSAAPTPGDADPPAPFAFGTVASVRGDMARLARAVEALADAGAEFVVIHGETGGDAERVAAAVRDRGAVVLHVGGDAALQSHVSAPRWWFRTRGVVVAGAAGLPGDAEWLSSKVPGGRADVLVTNGASPPAPCGVHLAARPEDDVRAALHRVAADRVVATEPVTVGAPLLRDRLRDAALGPLRGTASTPARFRGSLAAGAIALWCGAFLLLQRRTSTGTSGSASRNRFP